MKSTLKASMTLTMGAALMSFAALSVAQDVTGAGALMRPIDKSPNALAKSPSLI